MASTCEDPQRRRMAQRWCPCDGPDAIVAGVGQPIENVIHGLRRAHHTTDVPQITPCVLLLCVLCRARYVQHAI